MIFQTGVKCTNPGCNCRPIPLFQDRTAAELTPSQVSVGKLPFESWLRLETITYVPLNGITYAGFWTEVVVVCRQIEGSI